MVSGKYIPFTNFVLTSLGYPREVFGGGFLRELGILDVTGWLLGGPRPEKLQLQVGADITPLFFGVKYRRGNPFIGPFIGGP